MEPGNASYPNCALLPLLLCGSDCPVAVWHLAGHPGIGTGQSNGNSPPSTSHFYPDKETSAQKAN